MVALTVEPSYRTKMNKSLFLLAAILLDGCRHQATYAEGCGQLPANWISPREGRSVWSLLNEITVASDGSISWNKSKISEAKFGSYLNQIKALNPTPVTHIKFEPGVDCGKVSRLRQRMSETLDCTGGQCAEGRGRWWIISDVGPPFSAYDPHPNLPQDQ